MCAEVSVFVYACVYVCFDEVSTEDIAQTTRFLIAHPNGRVSTLTCHGMAATAHTHAWTVTRFAVERPKSLAHADAVYARMCAIVCKAGAKLQNIR